MVPVFVLDSPYRSETMISDTLLDIARLVLLTDVSVTNFLILGVAVILGIVLVVYLTGGRSGSSD